MARADEQLDKILMVVLDVECERKIKIKDDSKLSDLSYWVLDSFCRDEKNMGVADGVESLLSLRCLSDI